MNDAERFFYKHAGWSYQPSSETPEQGRRRCAREAAVAERWAREAGVRFRWEDDWDIGSHVDFYDVYLTEPERCEQASAYLPGSQFPDASLGCIDDATPEYRRVIESELAEEIMAELPFRAHLPAEVC